MNRPQQEHTELEEELHERAHIDYDRVSIVSWIASLVLVQSSRLLLDRQPIRTCSLRRCPRLRDWVCHDLDRRALRVLWREDWTVSSRQAHCERGVQREGRLVGTCEQADEPRGESRASSLCTAAATPVRSSRTRSSMHRHCCAAETAQKFGSCRRPRNRGDVTSAVPRLSHANLEITC